MNALIGYTGFVGSNLKNQFNFDELYNSKNIKDIRNKKFDVVVCAGVRAQKWYANQNPHEDMEMINQLINDIKTIKCKKFILISTIDVYKVTDNVDENTKIDINGLHPYGYNRYYLENWVESYFENALIVRLPALFGQGLKKNFIYDIITKIPSVIMKEKMSQISNSIDKDKYEKIIFSYEKDSKGNYKLRNNLEDYQKKELISILEEIRFTSLIFTDSRNEYPFYYLKNLWKHIQLGINNNIKTLNLAVEPISAKEIAKECFNLEFTNILQGKQAVKYDMKTIHCEIFNSNKGYIYSKDEVINHIKEFSEKEGKL